MRTRVQHGGGLCWSMLLLLPSVALLTACSDEGLVGVEPGVAQQALDERSIGCEGGSDCYRILLGNNFAPFDVGAFNGLNYDILTAICSAGVGWGCTIVDADYNRCFLGGEVATAIGGDTDYLGDPSVDACMGWFVTNGRLALNVSFTDVYAAENAYSTSLLVARDGPGSMATICHRSPDNPDNERTITVSTTALPAHFAHGDEFGPCDDLGNLGGARIGFFSGFFNDPVCLADHYQESTFEPVLYEDQAGANARTRLLEALAAGDIQYIFWDSADEPPAGTAFVGEVISDCAKGLAAAGCGDFVDTQCLSSERVATFVGRFNDGLAALQASGALGDICASWIGSDCVLE